MILYLAEPTEGKQLCWQVFYPETSRLKESQKANIPQGQTNGRFLRCVCVFVCVYKTAMQDDEDEVAGREEEEGRGVQAGGMCFPGPPSGAAFHWRYPERDLHLICSGAPPTPRGHRGSTLFKILTSHWNKQPSC